MCKEIDIVKNNGNAGGETRIINIPDCLPDRASKPSPPQDAIIPPIHKSAFSGRPNLLEGKNEFEEMELSSISD